MVTENNNHQVISLGKYEQNTSTLLMGWQFGLNNGMKMEQDIKDSIEKPSIIVFEVVSLREVNEVYGRNIGDLLLLEIQEYLLSWNIPNVSLYRLSGSKFCVTLYHATTKMLNDRVENLIGRIYKAWTVSDNNKNVKIYCRFAICVIESCLIDDSNNLLNILDMTLKLAKTENNIIYYDKKMANEFSERHRFMLALTSCVAENMDGFEVHYQPIADPVTGKWCGLEALCRWNTPELGNVPPLSFISMAERLYLINVIGLWVLETAVRGCKTWKLDKYMDFTLHVNVSAMQFNDPKLPQKIIDIIYRNNYPGEKLCLEITESTQFTFSERDIKTFNLLKAENIAIALDDFGTGYSAINKLRELPVDIVKVERVFVTGIENDSYLYYLFHVIADLAHTAGKKVIAEGVENIEQMRILHKNGADLLQGYLFSEPIPPNKMEQSLNRFYDVETFKHSKGTS